MAKLSEQDKKDIIRELTNRGATHSCPRCGHGNFDVLDGYFNQTIQGELTGMVLGGPSVPSAVIACNKCGFLSQHALGILGLLPAKEGKQ